MLIDIGEDDTKYFSEDAIIIIRKILKKVGIKNFDFDITTNNKKVNCQRGGLKNKRKMKETKTLKQFIPIVSKRALTKNKEKPANHKKEAKIKQKRWFKS